MKKLIMLLMLMFAGLSLTVAAQTARSNEPQRVIVEVQQQQSQQQTVAAQKASEWVEVGNALGGALGGAAKSVVNEVKDITFGKDVSVVLLNKFTGVLVGIPVTIALNLLFVWFYRRNYMPYRVLVERSGSFGSRTRKWQVVNDDDNWSEGKSTAAAFTGGAWLGANALMLFAVIF